MSFPGSPRLVKGGLVLLDPETGAQRRVINLQYNPDSVQRTLQPMLAGTDNGDPSEAFRIKGPPVETIRLEAEMDATDLLEHPDQAPGVLEDGLAANLAALETVVYPASADLQWNRLLAVLGMVEILPVQAPLALFVWSRNRVVPVRITEVSVTEEAFDPDLNPIRARLSLAFRVLSVNDLAFESLGASVFLAYQKRKESLASTRSGDLRKLGVDSIL
ncbi:MAG TPA: hypothetical protein VGE01_09690 [Fimbriimonas sp.]